MVRQRIPTKGSEVLILTNREDISADFVILELQRRSWPYLRFNTEDFPTRARLTLSAPDPVRTEVRLPKATFLPNSIHSVWYRRPVPPRPPAGLTGAELEFAIREGQAALDNLWSDLRCLWVSEPARIREATPRLRQLIAASQLGLEVPPTIVTNDPETAREFAIRHAPVIVKPISHGLVPGHQGEPDRLTFTTLLRQDELETCLATLGTAPVLMQHFEPKVADLRATVVGQTVFCAAIYTPAGASIDWRALDPADLVHRPYELPPRINDAILALVHRFGLAFSAIDFLLTPDGRHVFLEVNPNGQWAWLEQELGTPISAAIADLLTARASV